jgi:hypothetical protein
MAWDHQKSGILIGRQHNTYDINFFGPSSMTTSVYLAALKAGAEMAEAMGDPERKKAYLTVYQRGVKTTDYGALTLKQFTLKHRITKSYETPKRLVAGEHLVFELN